MEAPVYITAQEAAERILTIKIAGVLLFVMVVIGCMWIIIRWKQSEERRLIQARNNQAEAKNASERIRVTEQIGMAMTEVLKQDSGWKAQYYALKAKYDDLITRYDALEGHNTNMEHTLESATGRNGFVPQEA